MGAAYGVLISLSINNLVRCVLVGINFHLQPFSIKTPLILGAGALSYWLASLIPELPHLFLDAAVRSAVFVSLFATVVLKGHLSEEVSDLYRQTLHKWGLRKAED